MIGIYPDPSMPTTGTYELSHLRALEAEAIHIIREVAAEFERPVLLFSGGKDSMVMLHLAVKAFAPARVPFPVMHVDTGHNFDEIIAACAEIKRRLSLDDVKMVLITNATLLDRAAVHRPRLVAIPALLEHLQAAAQRGQRIAQFVGQGGQELVLYLIARFQLGDVCLHFDLLLQRVAQEDLVEAFGYFNIVFLPGQAASGNLLLVQLE